MKNVFFIPTPIGNLGDITLRAIEIIKNVDFIYAEDTRNTLKLLNHLNIKKTLKSYHKDNEKLLTKQVLEHVNDGDKIGIVSDAGTPCISDPGQFLVKRLIENNIPFEVLPGANAILPALIMSGFDTSSFYFSGFLHHNVNKRKNEISELAREKTTIILFESPHRLKNTLSILLQYFKPPIAVCREITKKFEQMIYINSEKDIENLTLKGEFVIVMDNRTCSGESEEEPDYSEIEKLKKEGFSKRDIVKIMQIFGFKRNKVYKLLNK
ncbi:16S rRNA (cytidine(1402)-2'-O)-methyltransferase [Flexistipes sinusarabici]|uniref:16S rRNA (cytidine(1402)-2'-O)-methyltransferase n=1 Tax=Flexistipes sinusarabici TaxID=2352 RepID=UPI0023553EAA